jgi:hypothetical protein
VPDCNTSALVMNRWSDMSDQTGHRTVPGGHAAGRFTALASALFTGSFVARLRHRNRQMNRSTSVDGADRSAEPPL